jgi:hypothetical protein
MHILDNSYYNKSSSTESCSESSDDDVETTVRNQ